MLRRRLHLDRLMLNRRELLLLLLLQLLLLRIGFGLLSDGCRVRHFVTSFDDFRHIEDLRRSSDRLKTIATRSYSPVINKIDEAAENLRCYFRTYHFYS